MGEKFGESVTSWAYQYNQRNPTSKWKGVGHAAENWMMSNRLQIETESSRQATPMVAEAHRRSPNKIILRVRTLHMTKVAGGRVFK